MNFIKALAIRTIAALTDCACSTYRQSDTATTEPTMSVRGSWAPATGKNTPGVCRSWIFKGVEEDNKFHDDGDIVITGENKVVESQKDLKRRRDSGLDNGSPLREGIEKRAA